MKTEPSWRPAALWRAANKPLRLGVSSWSLRRRLFICLGLVLAVTLAVGCSLLVWHAAASVRAEMQSALLVGRSTIVNGIAEVDALQAPGGEMRHLVGTFNGNRHVRARLTDAQGRALAASSPLPAERIVPAWFSRAIDPSLPPVTMPVAGGGAITLATEPANEIAEVWDQAIDAARTLAVFFGLTLLVIHWMVGRALRPLARLSAGFARIGAGDYAARLDAVGPPELANLAIGFNLMAGQLGQMVRQNDHLQEQLLSLQEEERAELARDLHDEVGPLLFSAGIDAASLSALITTGRTPAALNRVEALRESVGMMQTHIRTILTRLRPLGFGAVALADGIENLVSFWRTRHPDIRFHLSVTEPDAALSDAVRGTICRVVQESLCNAVRHGQPGQIEITARQLGTQIVVRVTDDGSGAPAGVISPGFGLIGMDERVRAQSGSLAITGQPGGRGIVVTASLPCATAA